MTATKGARRKRRAMRRARRIARKALTILMAAALLCAAVLIGMEVWTWLKGVSVRNKLDDLYPAAASERLSGLFPAARAEGETAFSEPLERHGDFDALYEENPDIVGWLTAGEDISEPVVQRDNAYYLDHNFFGERDANGTLFLNEQNALNPRDQVLLIHGHNMKSGAMFGTLRRYADEAYMREHPLIAFRTIADESDAYYVPVSAFDASMVEGAPGYFDLTPINFATEDACRAYLAEIAERSYWRSPADVNAGDELLMLITCSYQHEDGRFLLICRKLRPDETPEAMKALFQES